MNKTKELAEKFYKFILKYEKFIENNKEYFKSLLTERELEIETAYYLLKKETDKPWEQLPKGKEIENLTDIINSNSKEFINYLKLNDKLYEQLYLLTKGEVRKNKLETHKKFDEEKFMLEFEKYKSGNLDKEIFSEKIIQLQSLYNEVVVLCDRWISIRRENIYKNYELATLERKDMDIEIDK